MTVAVLLASCLGLVPAPDDPQGYAAPPRLYAIYEPVTAESDLAILARVRPDLVCRGWFRWGDARDYAADAWLVERCRAMGVRLQGGNTLAAIYPGENGIDEATFRDYATRGPDGRLVDIAGWYHVTLHNTAAREYLQSFVRRQIDAGADGVWFDEIEGIYGWVHEGYDNYAIRDFAEWLHTRYVVGLGWAEDDERFTADLGIPQEMLTAGIRGFDYREWLERTPGPHGDPLATDPWAGPWDKPWESASPLYRLWGHAWGPDERLAETFQGETVLGYWRWFVEDARRYARERYGRELIVTCNENGTPRPYVDFQQPHDGSLPRMRQDGRLDATYSTLPWLEERLRLSERVTPGKPVVQFVDWPGETDRMNALSAADLRVLLHTYIPEAYAAGALFAVPVRGFTYDASTKGSLPETAAIADFLRRYDGLLFEGSRPSAATVETGVLGIVSRVREVPGRTIVHLLDHRSVEERAEPTTLQLRLPHAAAYAWTTAPGSPLERSLAATGDGHAELSPFGDSAILVLEDAPPAVRGTVRDVAGEPIEGAHVTHLGTRRSALTDEEGAYAFAGAEAGELAVSAPGFAPARGERPDFRLATGGPVALECRFVDALGCAVVAGEAGARLPGQAQVAVSDIEGRFWLSLPEGVDLRVEARTPRAAATVTAAVGMPPLLLAAAPDDLALGDFERQDLWAPNDSEVAAGRPAVLTVERKQGGPHDASRCMEVRFAGLPAGGWANAYARAADLSRHDMLRFWYRGDGSAGQALLALHCLDEGPGGSFYTFALPLESTKWREVAVYLDEFRRDGAPPPRELLRRVSVQVAFTGDGPQPAATIALWGMKALGAQP